MRMTARQFARFSTRRLAGAGGGGGGGGGFAYATGGARYWRILVSDTNGTSACSATKIEMRETASGADVTGSGTASASSENSGTFAASKAFDGNAGTFWVSAGVLPHYWIAYDFGSGNNKTITEIVWQSRTDGFSGEAPNTFAVQQSSDGSTWLTTWLVKGSASWSTGETRTFTKTAPDTATHAYWRMRCVLSQDGFNLGLAELEFRATAGGADQTSGGTVIKSGEFDATTGPSGSAATNAFDNDTSTGWGIVGTTGWIGYHFASAVAVLQIAVNSKNSANYAHAPHNFLVEWSDDGSTWTPAWIATFAGFAQNELKTSTRA